MEAESLIKIERTPKGIAFVLMNCPSTLNSLSKPMMADLARAFSQLDHDDSVKVIILSGAGRAFCSGVDLTVLNSPWDICFDPVNDLVYIAMAGQHQIWVHNVKDGITKVFSGDGFERNLNGSSSGNTSFAQPSGISIFPGSQEAYIADSESSSIRSLDLTTGGSRLIAGGDPMFAENLFRFGDHDGVGTDALLQHPLGILCAKDEAIYVADSYNHKIKKLDPTEQKS